MSYLGDYEASVWGAKWARAALRWEVVEHEQGHYDWRRIDEVVDAYLAQNMRVMGVIGEAPPKWGGQPGPALYDAFNKFAGAAVEHFKTKIQYWDVYNEVDSKYYSNTGLDKTDPQADINVLRKEMETIRQVDPGAKQICCSTGTSFWLQYDKRLYDAGLLNLMDIVSAHPYESGPPEEKQGPVNYVEYIGMLRSLVNSYHVSKPVWSTEANWVLGKAGDASVNAPNVDEHSQAEYVVRVNLLSMTLNVPYFMHSPYFFPHHRQLLVDTIAGYAHMTSVFSKPRNAKMLNLPEGVYGVTANTEAGTAGALWTTNGSAKVSISGISGIRFEDFYGNPVNFSASEVPLSGSPLYFFGSGTPSVSVVSLGAALRWAPLNITTWGRSAASTYTPAAAGLHVRTQQKTAYGNQLLSPKIPVQPNSCFIVRMTFLLRQGGIGIVPVDPSTNKHLGDVVHLFTVTGKDEYTADVQVKTQSSSTMQIVVTAANPTTADISDFDVRDAKIANCR